ncbi:MAG: hypothetical protein AABY07_07185 [Nanoarchaeota archaeon]
MNLSIKLIIFLLILTFFITACTQPRATPPNKEPAQPSEPELGNKKCGDYFRNNVRENYCAECGNKICEPFETCVPSGCTNQQCTTDCGPLYCEQDCQPQQAPPPEQVPGRLPEITATLRTCRIDSDCVKIEADCCGCSAGGKADTINKEYLQDWRDTIAVKCQNIACPAVMSNHWSCTAEIKCVLNKCNLVR